MNVNDSNIFIECYNILNNISEIKIDKTHHFKDPSRGMIVGVGNKTKIGRSLYEKQYDEAAPKNIKLKNIIYYPGNNTQIFSQDINDLLFPVEFILQVPSGISFNGVVLYLEKCNRPTGIITKTIGGIWFKSYSIDINGLEQNSYYMYKNNIFYRGYRDLKIMRMASYKDHINDNYSMALALSGIEQSPSYWTIEIRKDDTSLIMPTNYCIIKELSNMRDKTDGEKKKAILHIVRSHKRITLKKEVIVSKHLRGIENIIIGDMTVSITPPMNQIDPTKKIFNTFTSRYYDHWK